MNKVKYIVMAVINGTSKEWRFEGVEEKQNAIEKFKSLKGEASKRWLYSVDAEDETIWYNIGKHYEED